MVEKILVKTPAVTIVKMINWEKPQSIFLPPDFIENLLQEPEKRWALVILHSDTRILRVIPSTSPKVVKLTILGQIPKGEHHVAQCFLKSLKVVFRRIRIQTLYSFCSQSRLHNNPKFQCVYEGYLNFTGLNISQDQFKAELIEIAGVSKVDIYPITYFSQR